ncbi:hypothetical protein LCGC14_1257690, partial [marine sediment metagenome]
ENIRRLFKSMDHDTKEEALACLKNEYGLQDRKLVKKEWIKAGRIPEGYQEGIVAMFQNLLRKQHVKKVC